MTRGQRILGAVVTAVVLSVACGIANGDPAPEPAPAPSGFLHMRTPSTIHTDGGSDLRLPPGYFLDEPSYDKLDAEQRRLQDAETRLTAENKSMRASLAGWQPGWYTLVIATASAVALGWYAHDKL